jgi:Insertion element 4 transposase N-terminal/Transposase DDE domain
VILPPKPKQPTPLTVLLRRLDKALAAEPPLSLNLRLPLDHAASLYLFCPLPLVLSVLNDTGRQSQRQRRLPAQHVVYFVIASSLWRDKGLPDVWQQLHTLSQQPEPDPSAFTHARKRLGVRPLRTLFRRLVCAAQPLPGACYKHWRLLALDGSVWEMPDTPANRDFFGSACNQHGLAAFPQLRVAALCEVLTHAVIDFEYGPYNDSELALSAPLLQRLPSGCLVLMDRGLSYFAQVRAVRQQGSEVLARVKVSRALPVEEVLPDGSYLSHIYPDYNASRRQEGGLAVRVIHYSHDDPQRASCGELTCLISTVLDWQLLSAKEAVAVFGCRWDEESVLDEVKTVLQQGQAPLLRSKTPELVQQELYGLLLAHYLTRQVMAQAAQWVAEEPTRLSFKSSLETLKQWLTEKTRQGFKRRYRLLLQKVAQKELRDKRERSYPREKKAGRQKWPMKRAGQPAPEQPGKPFAQAVYLIEPLPVDQREREQKTRKRRE